MRAISQLTFSLSPHSLPGMVLGLILLISLHPAVATPVEQGGESLEARQPLESPQPFSMSTTDLRVLDALERKKATMPPLSEKDKVRNSIREDLARRQQEEAIRQAASQQTLEKVREQKRVIKPALPPKGVPSTTITPTPGTLPFNLPSAGFGQGGNSSFPSGQGAVNPYNQYYFQVMENLKRQQSTEGKEKGMLRR